MPDRKHCPARRIALLAVCALLIAVATLVGPDRSIAAKETQPPDVDAAAWILVALDDGARLAAHAPGEQRSIASTTKLMTAYLALGELRPDQKLRVPPYSPAPAESIAGLTEGERLTVRDLLTAMLLPSANDAAETVAVGVSGSVDDFVDRMNRAAGELGLSDTHYSNPIGLDDIGNYSSAADLATLTERLLDNDRFRAIVAMPEADLRSGAMPRHVVTRNTLMLSDPSVDGVKTGHTTDAGYVLVASAERKGVRLLSVVLGAPSEAARDADSEQLLDYGYSLYRQRSPFRSGAELASADARYEDAPLGLIADGRVRVRARQDQDLETRVDAPAEVEGPIEAGERLGRATVTLDGEVVGRVPLVAASAVAAPSFVDHIGGTAAAVAIVVAAIVILLLVVLALRRRSDQRNGWRRNAARSRRGERGGA